MSNVDEIKEIEKNISDLTATLEAKKAVAELSQKVELFAQKGYKKTAREIIGFLNNQSKAYDESFKSKFNVDTDTIEEYLENIDNQIRNTSAELAESMIDYNSEKYKEIQQLMLDLAREKGEIIKSYDNKSALVIGLCKDYVANPSEELKNDIVKGLNNIIFELEYNELDNSNSNENVVESADNTKKEIMSNDNTEKIDTLFEKSKERLKVVIASILAIGVLAVACNTKNPKDIDKKIDDEMKNDKTTEDTFDYEANSSYQYFVNNGVRIDDAENLTDNSIEINKILANNEATDIKESAVDDLLLDIYNGHNITSSAENYDSLDTLTSLENAGTVDVYNYLLKTDDTNSSDVDKNANILGFANYLDENNGSTFDKCMESLVKVSQSYFKELENQDKAQALIDTIYDVNKISGTLNAQEEGIVTEFIMAVGPTTTILFPELKVTDTDITVNELINNIVNEIEMFERDCSYTRTLN